MGCELLQASMLTPSHITQPGFYWYFDANGTVPVVVEVVAQAGRGVVARFPGRVDEHLVSELPGRFRGPRTGPDPGRSPTRVAIVDDHHIVVSGLKQYFAEFPDLQVIGEAYDWPHAIELVKTKAVDVLLLDLSMPGMRGLDAMAKIRQASPHTQLVVLTGYPASSFESACRKAGAQAYMHKDCEPQQIVNAIRSVAERSAR